MNQTAILDQGAAYLAASFVGKADKIQSTRFIIDLWDELRQRLKLRSQLDYLAILLTQGRLMDIKTEVENCVNVAVDTEVNIHHELVVALTYSVLGEKNGSQILANSYNVQVNDIASAMLAAAFTRLSERVESAKEILDIWLRIRDMKIVSNNTDYLVALLSTSRINDLRKELEHPSNLKSIIENFRETYSSMQLTDNITKLDFAAAYLTNAIVTQTPEIESNVQIVEIWKKLKKDILMQDEDIDITAAILTGGLIINRTMKIEFDDIKDMYIRIKSKLEEMQNKVINA